MQNLRMRTKRYETGQGEGKNTKSFQTLGKQISMKNMIAKISDGLKNVCKLKTRAFYYHLPFNLINLQILDSESKDLV